MLTSVAIMISFSAGLRAVVIVIALNLYYQFALFGMGWSLDHLTIGSAVVDCVWSIAGI
jgi:hypothetical protein